MSEPTDDYLSRFPAEARASADRAYQDGFQDGATSTADDEVLASQALQAINAAIAEYDLALVRREHGDIAMHKAFRAIREATAAVDRQDPLIKCWPEPGEPSFNLLARDPAAAGLVEMWCDLRAWFVRIGVKPSEDMAKVIEARAISDKMRKWIAEHRPALNLPNRNAMKSVL